eukprot:m.304672 g.304672  ORF g.304672 m.304672 type:complete len:66 (+) comp19606_c0_seq12:102-299(+)
MHAALLTSALTSALVFAPPLLAAHSFAFSHFLNGSLSAVLKQEKRKVAFRASSRCRHKIHARVMW